MSAAAEEFWRFSLEVYGTPGVEPVCLTLQDRHGIDVNLLLVACWLGTRGVPLTDERAQGLEQAVAPWRDEVVAALRAVRRNLKGWLDRVPTGVPAEEVGSLRQRIKQGELMAEKVEQRMLAGLAEAWPADASPGADLVSANLKIIHGFPDDPEALRTLVDAANRSPSASGSPR